MRIISYFTKIRTRLRLKIFRHREYLVGWARSKGYIAPIELVYGEAISGFLVFLEKSNAENLALVNNAIDRFDNKGVTWGEFKFECPESYEQIIQHFEGNGALKFEDWISLDSNGVDWPVEPGSEQEKKAFQLYKNEEDYFERLPLMDETFALSAADREGMSEWLMNAPQQNEIIPADLCDRFGYYESLFDRKKILAENEKDIIFALGMRGYTCKRDDTLIWEACGGGSNETDPELVAAMEKTWARVPQTIKDEFEIQEELEPASGWNKLIWDDRHNIKPGAVIREYVKPQNTSGEILYNEYKTSSEIYINRCLYGKFKGRSYEAVDLYEGKTVSTESLFNNEIWIKAANGDDAEGDTPENGG